jgi:hypothetical protein
LGLVQGQRIINSFTPRGAPNSKVLYGFSFIIYAGNEKVQLTPSLDGVFVVQCDALRCDVLQARSAKRCGPDLDSIIVVFLSPFAGREGAVEEGPFVGPLTSYLSVKLVRY